MIKELLCSLPLPIKLFFGNMKTIVDKKKCKAIKRIYEMHDEKFAGINTMEYKKNLAKFLMACAYSGEETNEYIGFLYNDKVEIIYKGTFDSEKPTIICVVKNEGDKLEVFFEHYKALGEFNYVFIDNGSTDESCKIIKDNKGTIYLCHEQFKTNRKLSWINKVYSTLPDGMWTILLDADELLVFYNYEQQSFNHIIAYFDRKGIRSAGAIMIDMFSPRLTKRIQYFEEYMFFENRFHEEKSYYFNSVYGGIREREFKFGKDRIFLIKKHPILKKDSETMLIHCHYNYPFIRNLASNIYFGLLHYKLFDNELEKYEKIASEGSYGNGSVEYKSYLSILNNKTYEQIFAEGPQTIKYAGTSSLRQIECLLDLGEVCID